MRLHHLLYISLFMSCLSGHLYGAYTAMRFDIAGSISLPSGKIFTPTLHLSDYFYNEQVQIFFDYLSLLELDNNVMSRHYQDTFKSVKAKAQSVINIHQYDDREVFLDWLIAGFIIVEERRNMHVKREFREMIHKLAFTELCKNIGFYYRNVDIDSAYFSIKFRSIFDTLSEELFKDMTEVPMDRFMAIREKMFGKESDCAKYAEIEITCMVASKLTQIVLSRLKQSQQ